MSVRVSTPVRTPLVLVALLALSEFAKAPIATAQPAAHHAGLWTTSTPWPGRASFAASVNSVHMALLRGDTLFDRPHSKVMSWGSWSPLTDDGGLWAWNPSTDVSSDAIANLTPTSVPRPPFYVFCAGHSLLGNGDLLIIGGTDRGHTGVDRSARFRLLDGQWSSANMNFRRWYGNGTIMPDGKMLATAGN